MLYVINKSNNGQLFYIIIPTIILFTHLNENNQPLE